MVKSKTASDPNHQVSSVGAEQARQIERWYIQGQRVALPEVCQSVTYCRWANDDTCAPTREAMGIIPQPGSANEAAWE